MPHTLRYGALLGLTAAAAGSVAAVWPEVAAGSVDHPPIRAASAGCRVILVATGSYRLTVHDGGPLPRVEFEEASGPTFHPIQWEPSRSEALRDCDRPMGDPTVTASPNVKPIIYQVTNDLWAKIRVDHPVPRGGRWEAEYPYRDFGNLASKITRDRLWAAFRQLMADIASNLIARYADPGGLFSDAGAKWVAQQAVKLMMQAYVEGRDPGLIIDGLLTDMANYLQSHAETAAESAGGPALKAAVRDHLKKIAAAVTAELVAAQPDGQTVEVSAYNSDKDCTHDLMVWWNFKGGNYRAVLTITCGSPPRDEISRMTATNPVVEPGDRGAVAVQAFNRPGAAFPLLTATVTGIAPVRPVGAGEPGARIPGAAKQAFFDFSAADPRADRDYPFTVRVTTSDATGRLTGTVTGKVTVLNVAPSFMATVPDKMSAQPGGTLDLSTARLFVTDRNADASNPGEVDPRTIALTHPAGLKTSRPFGPVLRPRRVGHDAGTGMLRFDFDGGSPRVNDPHPSGTYPVGITAADDQRLTASGTIDAVVENVAPTVERVTVAPAYVHQNGSAEIQVRIRVRDRNTAADIQKVQVDSRPAASSLGSLAAIGSGLKEVGRGADWIEFELTQPFIQAKTAGKFPVPVEVRDSMHVVKGSGTLHVGNEAPRISGYGYLLDADSVAAVENPEQFVLVPADGLCPGDHFRAGLIASDPENDSLKVTARFRGTGVSTELPHTSDSVWVGDLVAPDAPGTYTLELTVTEAPPDKSATVTMTIVVKDCGPRQEEDPRVALADPATPEDIAAAPADPTGQKEFAAIIGSGVVAPSGELPGTDIPPSGPAVALLDSIGLVLSGSGDPMAPPVETYILATGGSTGPVGQMFAINRSDVPIRLPRSVMVVEPVAITPDIQARVTDLLQRYIAAGGSPVTLDMYCLERLRLPPAGGTLLRIVAEADAAPFRRFSGILDAVERVRDGIGLHPDSDPTEYFHAIRQWALWSAQEEFDADGFAAAFVETTRQTLEAGGQEWTAEVEEAVRGLIPNRWTDVRSVLREAGFSPR